MHLALALARWTAQPNRTTTLPQSSGQEPPASWQAIFVQVGGLIGWHHCALSTVRGGKLQDIQLENRRTTGLGEDMGGLSRAKEYMGGPGRSRRTPRGLPRPRRTKKGHIFPSRGQVEDNVRGPSPSPSLRTGIYPQGPFSRQGFIPKARPSPEGH